jgi:HlyD family secretion protein
MPRRPRSRRKLIILIALPLLIVGLGVAGWVRHSNQGDAVAVQTEEVVRGEVVEMVAATGRVQPQSEVKISANVSGRIERLGVKEGDPIEPGQFLVEIDPTRYRALVRESEAGLRSARAEERLAAANLEQSVRDHERLERVRAQGLSSAGELESAETARRVSEARLDAAREAVNRAEALLARARDDLSKTAINAPIGGVITRLNVEAGEVVLGTNQNVGTTIMTLADLAQMEVLTEIDESEVVKVALGDSAMIELDALPDYPFRGRVSEIANSAITRGRGTAEEATHFEVKVAFTGEVDELRPGMSATVDLFTDRSADALNLPIQCVTLRSRPEEEEEEVVEEEGAAPGAAVASGHHETPGRHRNGSAIASNLREVVFVVRDGVAHEVPVETGISSPTQIEILAAGLEEGDEVVAGSYRVLSRDLEDGDPVRIDNQSLRRGRGGHGGGGARQAANNGGAHDDG